MPTPEQLVRQKIDQLLAAAGWVVQDFKHLNLGASIGVDVLEYQAFSIIQITLVSRFKMSALLSDFYLE